MRQAGAVAYLPERTFSHSALPVRLFPFFLHQVVGPCMFCAGEPSRDTMKPSSALLSAQTIKNECGLICQACARGPSKGKTSISARNLHILLLYNIALILHRFASRCCRIWDVASGRCTGTVKGHKKGVLCVAVSPDGKNVASGSDDSTIT